MRSPPCRSGLPCPTPLFRQPVPSPSEPHPMPRSRCGLGVAGLFCSCFLLLLPPAVLAEADKAQPPVRLAVLVVFDQLRGAYLQRWDELYVDDGFHRLEREGVWFQNCHYPYALTLTGPGHASLATGASPSKHGIIANEWFERPDGRVHCAGHLRYQRVPPGPTKQPPDT